MLSNPTAAELHTLLLRLLAGATDEREARWVRVVTKVHMQPLVTHPACNWTAALVGTADEREAAEKAIAFIRAEHPYVRCG